MNKALFALFIGIVSATLCRAQIGLTKNGDSVYTVPLHPTTHDSITFNYYDSSACCCAAFVGPVVNVADTQVFLVFSVNTAPCQVCMCIAQGVWHAFKSGPLKAGKYGIYREQSVYCTGIVCPQIALLPVRIGEVVVSNTAITVVSQNVSKLKTLTLTPIKCAVKIEYDLNQAGRLRLMAFDARGNSLGSIYNNKADAGPVSFTWNAPAGGVYIIAVTNENTVLEARTVAVSR